MSWQRDNNQGYNVLSWSDYDSAGFLRYLIEEKRWGREDILTLYKNMATTQHRRAVEDSLFKYLSTRRPLFQNTQLDIDVDIDLEILVSGGCCESLHCRKTDQQRPKPPHPPDPPQPDLQGWNCATDGDVCRYLNLQAKSAGPAVRAEYPVALTNPVTGTTTLYHYPMDTWLTLSEITPIQSQISVRADGKTIRPTKENHYLIPAGTMKVELDSTSAQAVNYQYSLDGACSVETPCLSTQIQDWTAITTYWNHDLGYWPPNFTQPVRLGPVEDAALTHDVLLTVTDVIYTAEQYSIYVDGQEIGKTHGATYLGKDMYDRKYILNDNLQCGYNYKWCITQGAFWGTFKIPRGSKNVTLAWTEGYTHDTAKEQWGNAISAYRIDLPCSC
jgi:hypothetical protein